MNIFIFEQDESDLQGRIFKSYSQLLDYSIKLHLSHYPWQYVHSLHLYQVTGNIVVRSITGND